MNPKQLAGEAALKFVRSDTVVGLGTGSTADWFIRALAEALKAGQLRNISGVPTSRQSERLARELGIPLVNLGNCPRPDVTVDGADEIDPELNLIKGLGGALLREKVVAQNSRRLVIVADASKSVAVLGTKAPLPVEVATFCHEVHVDFFKQLGAQPVLRRTADGSPFVTDNGNCIYDCRFPRIDDPRKLEDALVHRAGIVQCGLFIGLAQVALLADEHGVQERVRRG